MTARITPAARAWLLTIGGAGLVAVVTAVVSRWPDPLAEPHVSWLLLALFVALTERMRVHLHFARETHSFSLSELPTTVGLFLVAPGLLVAARALGIALALTPIHWRNPLKLVFNVVNGALEAAAAVLLFRALLPLTSAPVHEYAVALLAMALASVTGTVLVWLVIRIVEGHRRVQELVAAIRVYSPIGVANAAVALALVVVARVDPALVWIPLVPLGVLLLAYRAYVGQWQHRDALDFLYETAVETHALPDLGGALAAVLRGGRAQLKADVAELIVLRSAGAETVLVVSAGPGSVEEVRQVDVADLPLETRQILLSEGGDQEHRSATSVWVRSSGLNGMRLLLRAATPIGNEAVFDVLAVEILRSLSRLAVTAVERSELDELKSSFLSAVSHELRTPLTVVLGAAATLKHRDDVLDRRTREDLVDRLDSQARRLDKLLTDLLDIDRLTRGVIEPRRRTVDVVDLAQRVVGALDITGHRVVIQGADVVADVDPALTERIVENLVKNAAKYSPTETTITVELLRRPDAVAIVVEDEGPGIPEDRRLAVLDPFVRLDNSHPQPGTGIGLSLVRRFAQLHDGDVIIEAGTAGGARVTVWLSDPVEPPSPRARLRLLRVS